MILMNYKGNGQVQLYGYVRATGQGAVEYAEIDTETTPSEIMERFFSDVLNTIRTKANHKVNIIVDRKIEICGLERIKDFIRAIPSQSLEIMLYYFFSKGNWQAEGIGDETDLSVIIHEVLKERGEE